LSDDPGHRRKGIKQEPQSDSDSSVERKPKSKEHKHKSHHQDRSHHNSHSEQRSRHGVTHDRERRDEDRERRQRDRRDHDRPHQVRVKQEPLDSDEEMRQQRAHRQRNDERRRENRQRRDALPENERFGRRDDQQQEEGAGAEGGEDPKDAPNFELSGKLTEDTNTYKGVVIKYNEPPEARKPKRRWRLYPFKNDEALKPFHMHRQSAFLFGRERLIADIPVDHPSCSKQHAVLQYRMVQYEKPDGRKAFRIAPYIIDLESANGTFVNNKRIEARRYVELMEKDVIKFGFSSREYVLLHDKSNTDEVASDVSD